MEDVDNIILVQLRDIGVALDEVASLAHINAEQVYDSCLGCLKRIDAKKTESLPELLPRGMSTKVNAATQMVGAIKALGFRGDLGYNQILYPSAGELRKLFMWLLEALPKKSIDTPAGAAGPDLDELIAKHFTSLMHEVWAPAFAVKAYRQYARDVYSLSALPLTYPSKGRKLKAVPGLEKYYTQYLPYISRQVAYKPQVAPSVFETNLAAVAEQRERENEWNTKGLDSKLNPMAYNKRKADQISKLVSGVLRNAMNAVAAEQVARMNSHMEAALQQGFQAGAQGQFGRKLLFTRNDDELEVTAAGGAKAGGAKMSEEDLEKQREEEVAALDAQLLALQQRRAKIDEHLQRLEDSLRQIEQQYAEEDQKTDKLEREYKIKRRTFDLLPNAEDNIAQLKEISSQSSDRLQELAVEWEKHRVPLIEGYRKLRDAAEGRRGETEAKVNVIKELRAQMKEMMDDVHHKEERYRELLDVFGKLQKDVTRAHYTTRILEIVRNVKRQKVDIDKILIDTRDLQREINSISDTLSRTFAVSDELIFADAKKDSTAKEAYKKLVELDEQFKKLTRGVEESGQCRNAILNLEAKVQQQEGSQASLNFERVTADLKEIREENTALEKQVALLKVTG
eukprot:TRINITY_DN31661_c0_g1_i1.p1 TRINITY_DN31661_c0_g1~~TRINITY_DN31661_c0_g1_i1.p1  ORF type:complete len:625 (-),score=245.12 TRINITY_DN31661_c0_g1_i1:71-1945(-)